MADDKDRELIIKHLIEDTRRRSMSNVIDLARELANQLDQRNKARIAKEEAERVAWSENPLRYERQIINAVRKLRKIVGPTAVMVFLDEIIVGKVGGNDE